MNKILFFILINLLSIFSCTANALSDKDLIESKTKELIKGKSKKWIIIDGIGIGLVINSSKESENIIDPRFNEITNANGKINPPDIKCMGELSYYKGNILELSSNDMSGCGEGRVMKYENASPLLQKLSNLLLLQERIRSNIHNPKSDLTFLKKDIFKSVKELSSLVKRIKAGDYIKNDKENTIQGLNEAIKLNISSVQKIQKKEKLSEVFKDLSESYDKQIQVIEKVIKSDNYN